MPTMLLIEVRRLLREPQFLVFTIGFPVAFFLIFVGIYAPSQEDGSLVALMLSMAAFGAITASVSTGGLVATERSLGWNRQLRLTPLPAWGYLAVKAAVAMLVALPALAMVLVVGAIMGVDLPVLTWLQVLAVAWVGVLPFAAIGLLVGTLATQESAQGATMITMLLFSLLGGIFIPVAILPPAMVTIARALPSYWLADVAARPAVGGGVPWEGVAVLAAWFVAAGGLAVWRYRRDAVRV
ncbi:ABC transporter permease [Pseudonocardia humida]|uniref:ABC transporter permease n=1 Tax=Pseudonocardia humida TaxID=2800819 RepID=A0ABT1A105_9PSEU|nr:ABC transporter permease [Pseudonocardia humida]MCO1656683.1 ABC transporter permease [Pseudonocardia humida]